MDYNENYLALITSEYASGTKYLAYVKSFLDMISPTVDNLNSFVEIFDIFKQLPETIDISNPEPGSKLSIVDDQLDKLGELIGVSRRLETTASGIPSILNNQLFQLVLKAKIMANHWDGTIEGLNDIIKDLYPGLTYDIADNQDMSYLITMISPETPEAEAELLFNGYILPKPVGVEVNYTIMETGLFGWDSDSAFVAGWDHGLWGNI